MSDIHPYFVAKARAVFHEAQGDPDHSTALAEWAQEARRINDCDRGVIGAEDGELIVQTRYHRGAGATYVAAEDASRLGLVVTEVGLALGRLAAATGQRLIHVKMGQVCTGAGLEIPEGAKGGVCDAAGRGGRDH